MDKKVFVVNLNVGDSVICDNCNADFSHRTESGGFLIGSRGWCPDCEAESRALLRRYNEEHLITATCPSDMSHRDWILSIRRQ